MVSTVRSTTPSAQENRCPSREHGDPNKNLWIAFSVWAVPWEISTDRRRRATDFIAKLLFSTARVGARFLHNLPDSPVAPKAIQSFVELSEPVPRMSGHGTKRRPRELCATDARRLDDQRGRRPMRSWSRDGPGCWRGRAAPPVIDAEHIDCLGVGPARFFYRVRFRTLNVPGRLACNCQPHSGRDAFCTRHTFHRR